LARLKEEKIAGTLVYAGGFLEVHKDRVRLPDGSETVREYIRHPGAVVILPLLPGGLVLLERQFRYPHGREFIELPAGKREAGEDPLETAKRELLEETGYTAKTWKRIGVIHTAIAYTDEAIELFCATELEHVGRKLEAGEFLETLIVPFDEAIAMIRDGRITDAKTVAALLLVKDRG
jgi:ADP-ribose pyrophosphatase